MTTKFQRLVWIQIETESGFSYNITNKLYQFEWNNSGKSKF